MTEARDSGSGCPACRHGKWRVFYRLEGIPVHSCVLLPSERQALAFPRGDLELAVCLRCGFIWNRRFDPGMTAYAQDYEDQQCFSPTFNRFARALAQRILDRYRLHGKDILEIGCGKGDFLRLLCELGDNRGVGIDPSVSPRRHKGGKNEPVWVAEYFAGRHDRFPADFICCRHALEHVPDVFRFVHLLREVVGGRHIPVLFEVPDSTRVLEQGAFEDIYYEHCSYFTAGSLARLFRHCDFAVEDLYLDFGDQYIVLGAQPARDGATPPHYAEESPEQTILKVEKFSHTVTTRKKLWQDNFDRRRGEKIAIWGSGSKCVALLSSMVLDSTDVCVIDINPHRHGRFLAGSGLEIRPPGFLAEFHPHQVIAMNRIYREEIAEQLRKLNVSTELEVL